jgi:hypothetical protein|tara:strand:+ start:845 stop:1009 length:165 start_codon:yes stop_codon:yes gene_type:complete
MIYIFSIVTILFTLIFYSNMNVKRKNEESRYSSESVIFHNNKHLIKNNKGDKNV